MWIETSVESLRGGAIKPDENVPAPVEFSENGTAQVPADVGEYLVGEFPDAFSVRDDDDHEEDDSE